MAFPPSPRSPLGRPVSFPDWPAALASARLPPSTHSHFATQIRRFLRYCEILQVPVALPRTREYLARIPLKVDRPLARQALHWFFQAARRAPARSRS